MNRLLSWIWRPVESKLSLTIFCERQTKPSTGNRLLLLAEAGMGGREADRFDWAIRDTSHEVRCSRVGDGAGLLAPVTSEKIREDLLNAIHGAGAFRHFKDTLRRHRIESDWFTFRAEALKQIALDWCEERRISWQ
jgi:hypothetical protein